jgi:hypothetical protein
MTGSLTKVSILLGLIGVSFVGCRSSKRSDSGDRALDNLAQSTKYDAACTGMLDKSQGLVNLLADYHDKIDVQSKSAEHARKLRNVINETLATGVYSGPRCLDSSAPVVS